MAHGLLDIRIIWVQEQGKIFADIFLIEVNPVSYQAFIYCLNVEQVTLGLNGDGIGLNYHFGLFLQTFENHLQKENKNPWIEKESWLTKTDVRFFHFFLAV